MSLLQQLRTLKARRHWNQSQQQNGEEDRRRRYDEAWLKLASRMDGWLTSLVREELAEVVKDQNGLHIDVRDSTLEAPVVIRTSLLPVNRRVAGAEGRLDVMAQGKLLYSLLLFDNGHWELFDTSRGLVINRAFTALDIESLLEAVLLSEALKR